ncbi:unnamed protein product [Dicrocoelium dendriticum]|nr:unnamed protein product [Dicrocoelium dendriticum]
MLLVLLSLFTCTIVSSSQILRVQEGAPAGTVLIADLPTYLKRLHYTDSAKAREVEPVVNEDFILTIGNAIMPGVEWFEVSPVHKNLIVKKPPDRDSLCPSDVQMPQFALRGDRGGIIFPGKDNVKKKTFDRHMGECVVKLSIVHGPASDPTFDMISVILEDVNDHAPKFSVARSTSDGIIPFVIRVAESYGQPENDQAKVTVPRPLKIALPMASDPDYGVNGIHGYHLEGEDAHKFRVEISPRTEETQTLDSSAGFVHQPNFKNAVSSQLWLVLLEDMGNSANKFVTGQLDREQQAEYHLVLVAHDGGSPQRTARLPIRLVVEDVNDHNPVFSQAWYSGKISEDDPPGSTVLEFSAYDADDGERNGKIGFRIPGELIQHRTVGSTTTKEIFSSDSQGALSEAQLAAAQYFAIVIDRATNVNQFRRTHRHNHTHGKLIIRHQAKEQARLAAALAIRAARSGPNLAEYNSGTTSYNYSEQSTSSLTLEFVIEAFDYGSPTPLTSRVPIYVAIVEVNDHAPEIFVSYLRTQAQSSINRWSSASESSGWGRVKENIAKAMLAQITVIDEDDNYGSADTACNTSDTRFKLEEIASTGDLAGDPLRPLIAQGNDFYKHDQPNWSLRFPTSGTRRTDISAKMYKLMLVAALDRESSTQRTARIEFELTCVDNIHNRQPGGQLTTQVPLRILIEDVNDNPPVFLQKSYIFHIPENHPAVMVELDRTHNRNEPYFIGQVIATDADEGWHAAVSYELILAPKSTIEIDPLTGRLYAVRPFDRESTAEVNFQVVALDCRKANDTTDMVTTSVKRLSSHADVKIIVNDLNDCSPIFDQLNYHFEVEEGINMAEVGRVTATDADQGEAAKVVYRLAGGVKDRYHELSPFGLPSSHHTKITGNHNHLYSEEEDISVHFQIDGSTGVISLQNHLDRERKAHYEFVVLAVDNPSGKATQNSGNSREITEVKQFTASATVFITVLDKNDNPPHIVSPRNNMEFFLGSDQLVAGNTIFTVNTEDPDVGENGTVEFELRKVVEERDEWNTKIEQNRYAANTTSLEALVSVKKTEHDSLTESPFALDRTAGICYLRENLPPLTAAGPSAYLLHIRAYDLGQPEGLNNSVIVRVIRQPPGPSAYSMLPALYAGGDQHTVSSNVDSLRYSESRGYEQGFMDTWTSAEQPRLSDRTLVVVLSTVFALLLLTVVILMLVVRYRRTFLQNSSLTIGQYNASPLNRANPGYTLDKPFDHVDCVDESPGSFSEIFTAPWVNNSRAIESPKSIFSPAISIMPPGLQTQTGQRCVKRAGSYWPSMANTFCVSPAIVRRGEQDVRPAYQSPTSITPESPFYRVPVPRRWCLQKCQFGKAAGTIAISPNPLIMENQTLCLQQNDYYDLASKSRNSGPDKVITRSSGMTKSTESPLNKCGYLSTNPRAENRGTQLDSHLKLRPRSALNRTATSMEELHNSLEAPRSNEDKLTKLLSNNVNAINIQQLIKSNWEKSPKDKIGNDYQRLLLPISTYRKKEKFLNDDTRTSGKSPEEEEDKHLHCSCPKDVIVSPEATRHITTTAVNLLPGQGDCVSFVGTPSKCQKSRQSSPPDPLREAFTWNSSSDDNIIDNKQVHLGDHQVQSSENSEKEPKTEKSPNPLFPQFPNCMMYSEWCTKGLESDENSVRQPTSPLRSPTHCPQGSFV